MAGPTEQGVDLVTDPSFQPVSAQLAVILQVADHRLHGIATWTAAMAGVMGWGMCGPLARLQKCSLGKTV